MLCGYNTNGFAHHHLEHALIALGKLGYKSVAITLDHHALNPYDPGQMEMVARTRGLLEMLHLRSVIETGARFLLDPWQKHQPTLLSRDSKDRKKRQEIIRLAIDIAKGLGADAVSFWSGPPLANPEQ